MKIHTTFCFLLLLLPCCQSIRQQAINADQFYAANHPWMDSTAVAFLAQNDISNIAFLNRGKTSWVSITHSFEDSVANDPINQITLIFPAFGDSLFEQYRDKYKNVSLGDFCRKFSINSQRLNEYFQKIYHYKLSRIAKVKGTNEVVVGYSLGINLLFTNGQQPNVPAKGIVKRINSNWLICKSKYP